MTWDRVLPPGDRADAPDPVRLIPGEDPLTRVDRIARELGYVVADSGPAPVPPGLSNGPTFEERMRAIFEPREEPGCDG